jgi:hypothetical protein
MKLWQAIQHVSNDLVGSVNEEKLPESRGATRSSGSSLGALKSHLLAERTSQWRLAMRRRAGRSMR